MSDLWKEILFWLLQDEEIEVRFPQAPDFQKLFENKCCKALDEIKEVIEDESLEDKECFERIERIVRIFEEMGSDGGARHDFG